MIKVERAPTPVHITLSENAARKLTAFLSILQDDELLDLMNGCDALYPDESFDNYYRAVGDDGRDIEFPEVVVRR